MSDSNWRNWGDHPFVVTISLIAAVLGIIAFFGGKENKTPTNNNLEQLPPVSPSPPVPPRGKFVSQIIGIPLPGQPILGHGDSRDNQYREAMEVLEGTAARAGRRVVRLEVIKWHNVAQEEASRIRDGILWELHQRRISYNWSRQNDMSPADPRRKTPWMEIQDFDIQGFAQGRKQFVVGYWAIGQLETSGYVLLWAWALVS